VSSANDHRILEELAAAVRGGSPVVLATVIATEGSVPRHAGTKMIIRADGTMLGTIGGGKVEDTIRADALELLAERRPAHRAYPLRDPGRGDPGICGGIMTVYMEPYVTPHTLFIVGAGHVGRAVADLAHWIGYRTIVVDERPDRLTEEAMPNADVRFAGSVAAAIEHHPITDETSVVVVTRSHELDVEIVPLLLETPAAYIGVMGSRRRWQATSTALVEGGIDQRALVRIRNPIGFEIGAETVEEIAVSILSEIIAAANEDD
jgi:xanthine dehydrogenase accessory factor